MSSAILERGRSGAVLWERSCVTKLETGAEYTMCHHFNPSPLQFTGQCVISTLRRLKSGLESSMLFSMLTNKTNPVKEKKEEIHSSCSEKKIIIHLLFPHPGN